MLSVAEEIGRSVEEDGSDLKDSASPVLRRLRRELREGRGKLAERLRKIARDPALAEHLQDDFVTERGGRPVLALKASARGRVPGIVHDSSGSGQTLFVEPLAAVEDSNRLREAEVAERDEVARILRNLSSSSAGQSEELILLVGAAAELDLVIARGTLSRGWRGTVVTPSREVVLRGARHPLLDRASAVPIDLELGSLRALVISGPNTGGKTVALKTLGLAAALYQSGLRPPADEASLPVFDEILVDIGDEQSIAMSLSTFSATPAKPGRDPRARDGGVPRAPRRDRRRHRSRRGCGARRGTARPPREPGAADRDDEPLRRAEGVGERRGRRRQRRHRHRSRRRTSRSTRSTLGRPGTSHALATAERLGLPAPIVAAARDRIAPERLQVAELVAEAEAAAREAQATLAAAAGEQQEAETARLKAERAEEGLRAEIEQVRASAAAERQRAEAAETELSEGCGPSSRSCAGDQGGTAAGARARPRDDTGGKERRPSATAGWVRRRIARFARRVR